MLRTLVHSTVKMRIAILLLLVGCTTHRTETATTYSTLPSRATLQRDVQRLGAPAVIRRFKGNPELLGQLCDQIASPTRDWRGLGVGQSWFDVVVALGDAADESLADCFETALTDALPQEPAWVLAAIQKSPNRAALLERVCRNPTTRVSTRWAAPSWKELTISHVRAVPEELATDRDECLAALQKIE